MLNRRINENTENTNFNIKFKLMLVNFDVQASRDALGLALKPNQLKIHE